MSKKMDVIIGVSLGWGAVEGVNEETSQPAADQEIFTVYANELIAEQIFHVDVW